MWCTVADTFDGLEADNAVRENDLNCLSSQLGSLSSYVPPSSVIAGSHMAVGSSKTLQPHHTRPTDLVHSTRDAGVLMVYCVDPDFCLEAVCV